jgi:hypothetical protein
MHFLDDWLFLGQNKDSLQTSISWFLDFIQNLGFLVSVKKSRLELAQNFEYLGVNVNPALQRICPAEHIVT